MDELIYQIICGVTTLGIAWLSKKGYNTFQPILKVMEHIKLQSEARKDGVLTIKEKAKLYDSIEDNIKEAYAFAKGISFWKSK